MLARGYALAVRTCILLAVASCTPDFTIPPGVVVNCDDGACPGGYFCQQSTKMCVRDSGRRNNQAPVVTAFSLDDDPVLGLAVMRFTVSDSSADVVYVSRLELAFEPSFAAPQELSLDAGAGKSFPSGAIVSLPTSREGVAHSVTWNSAVGAPVASPTAYLRLTVADVYDVESAPAVFGPFAILNQTPPRAEIVFVKSDGDASAGVVPIVYRLVDDQSDMADVRLEYSSDGVVWTRCSEYPTLFSEGTTDLATAPASVGGITHAFYWDTIADAFPSATPQLRITAADSAVGEPYVLSSSLSTGFPNDPSYVLTNGYIANDLNTCDWIFGQLNGAGLVDGMGTCGYPGVVPAYLIRNGTVIQHDGYRSAIVGYVGNRPLIALGDVDGDGDLDLLFGSGGASPVAGISLNDGAGAYASPVVTALSAATSSLAAGDFDGDGRDEAVLVSNGLASVLRWTTTTVLNPHAELGSGITSVMSTRLDPAHDVLFVQSARTTGFEATSGLTFGAIPVLTDIPCVAGALAVDLDGSGHADLVCAAAEQIVGWKDPLASGAHELIVVSRGRYADLFAGDVDNDGTADFVAITDTHSAVVPFLSRGGPDVADFPVTVAAPLGAFEGGERKRLSGAAVTDLDGDGAQDLLVGTDAGFAHRFFAAPELSLAGLVGRKRTSNRLLGTPSSALSVDVDRDGAADLVLAHGNRNAPNERGGIEVVRATALGGVPILGPGESISSPADTGVVGVAIADFDGDGLLDAATVGLVRNELLVYYGESTESGAAFSPEPVTQTFGGLDGSEDRRRYEQPIVACNVDADPQLELLVFDQQATLHQLRVVDIDAARTITTRVAFTSPQPWAGVACADLNADGYSDVVVSGPSSASGRIHLGSAAGTFTPRDPTQPGAAFVFADWDRDGVTDIVYGSRGGSSTDVLTLRGTPSAGGAPTGTFQDSTISGICENYGTGAYSATGDLDADGENELVTVCNDGDGYQVSRAARLNNGNGTHTDVGGDALLSRTVVYDADGDDVVDLVGIGPQDQRATTLPVRRLTRPWSWQASAADARPARLITAPEPRTDRFGARVVHRLALRPYVTSRDGGARDGFASHEDLGDLSAIIRTRGLAGRGKALVPLTNAWVLLGLTHVAHQRDPFSGDATATRSRLVSPVSASAVVVRIPLRPSVTVANARVFIETFELARADEAVAGADGPWGADAHDYLPRDARSGSAIVVYRRTLHEIPVDTDGDIVTGAGERFVVDSVSKTVRIVMNGPGTVQLFNAPL